MLTKDIFWKELFVSEFLSALKKEWFSSYKFSTSIRISDIKYIDPRLKYNSSFYLFNHQLHYILDHYFVESETNKDNVNKFSIGLLMISLNKKFLYKNANK